MGRGKKSNCIQEKLHEKDITKGIKIIANWLIKISNTDEETKKGNILKSISEAIITPTKTTSLTFKSDEIPSFFAIQILLFNTSISNKECDNIDCEKFGREFGIKLWKSREVIK